MLGVAKRTAGAAAAIVAEGMAEAERIAAAAGGRASGAGAVKAIVAEGIAEAEAMAAAAGAINAAGAGAGATAAREAAEAAGLAEAAVAAKATGASNAAGTWAAVVAAGLAEAARSANAAGAEARALPLHRRLLESHHKTPPKTPKEIHKAEAKARGVQAKADAPTGFNPPDLTQPHVRKEIIDYVQALKDSLSSAPPSCCLNSGVGPGV